MTCLRIGVISDTHIPRRAKRLPDKVLELFDGADAILHAGDFLEGSVLDELRKLAPVHAVLGNCDSVELASLVPSSLDLELGGVLIGMVHDSGPASERRTRMKRAFPGRRVVVFGHSHRPMIEDDGELLLLNPGSACDPRSAKIPTVATLVLDDGEPRATLIEI